MALTLHVIIIPLLESDPLDNQRFIDRAEAANANMLPDDPARERVPALESYTKITYLESSEEMIGGTAHTLQKRQDVKYFGSVRPRLGVPQIFQARLVEYQIRPSDPVGLSYKLMTLIDPAGAGLEL